MFHSQQLVPLEKVLTMDIDFIHSSYTFPEKLFVILEKETGKNVIEWCEKGICFLIIDEKSLLNEIIPRYFKQKKIASFYRQLNSYGFRKITRGNEYGSYFHPKFQRSHPELLNEIQRLPIKRSGLCYEDVLKECISVSPDNLSAGEDKYNHHHRHHHKDSTAGTTTKRRFISCDDSLNHYSPVRFHCPSSFFSEEEEHEVYFSDFPAAFSPNNRRQFGQTNGVGGAIQPKFAYYEREYHDSLANYNDLKYNNQGLTMVDFPNQFNGARFGLPPLCPSSHLPADANQQYNRQNSSSSANTDLSCFSNNSNGVAIYRTSSLSSNSSACSLDNMEDRGSFRELSIHTTDSYSELEDELEPEEVALFCELFAKTDGIADNSPVAKVSSLPVLNRFN